LPLHIASRLTGLAGPSEVLVSSTVRDLVVGSGFTFIDRGLHALKGVSEPRQVFALACGRRQPLHLRGPIKARTARRKRDAPTCE
jgi:class 3 adenylate cyclase